MKVGPASISVIGRGALAKELEAYVTNLGYRCILLEKYDSSHEGDRFILGSGNPAIKSSMYEEMPVNCEYGYVNLSNNVFGRLNDGCIANPGSVVAPMVKMGKHILFNYNCSVGHDVEIGDFSTISPNAFIGGNSVIGKMTFIGAGSCIREKLKIGNNCIIGMGAVVLKDVPDNSTVVGNPGLVYPNKEWELRK